MSSKVKAWEFDPSPLYACDVKYDDNGYGQVVHWMAFDPEYGPESEAQIDWHRREYGARHVRGWKVSWPLPGATSEHAKWQRKRAELAEVDHFPENPEIAALESGDIRNNSGGTSSSPPTLFVTDICGWCGADLPETLGGRKRRDGAVYCSAAHKQAAYRERLVRAA